MSRTAASLVGRRPPRLRADVRRAVRRGRPVMSFLKPRYWIAGASAGAVLLLAFVDSGRTAPGPLTAVHEREPDLDGRRDCSECHGGWRRTMSEACMDCHEAIAQDVEGAT